MKILCIILALLLVLILLLLSFVIQTGRKKAGSLEIRIKELEKELAGLREENADMTDRLLTSQLRPHFFYNTLNAIYYLCKADPLAAQSAINSFSEYMRENMEFLENSDPISIDKELEIVRNYLELEKLRMSDDLYIEYDIRARDFVIPPLSIETLVENAVKHGIGKSENGGKITICTKRDADSYTISVSDNGAGFDRTDLEANEKDDRSHIGLSNLKKRLKTTLNGSLTIDSRKGKGTSALIRIPAKGPVNDGQDREIEDE